MQSQAGPARRAPHPTPPADTRGSSVTRPTVSRCRVGVSPAPSPPRPADPFRRRTRSCSPVRRLFSHAPLLRGPYRRPGCTSRSKKSFRSARAPPFLHLGGVSRLPTAPTPQGPCQSPGSPPSVTSYRLPHPLRGPPPEAQGIRGLDQSGTFGYVSAQTLSSQILLLSACSLQLLSGPYHPACVSCFHSIVSFFFKKILPFIKTQLKRYILCKVAISPWKEALCPAPRVCTPSVACTWPLTTMCLHCRRPLGWREMVACEALSLSCLHPRQPPQCSRSAKTFE